MSRVLQLGAYRRLLVAYTLNELAWGFGALALSYLVYRRTGSPLGAAGFYLCSQFVPALVAPLLVARVERVPVRIMLPLLYTVESLSFCGLALLVGHFSLVPVLALTLLDGTLALTARPLARATTVEVTAAAGLLREGNALTNSCFSVSFMLGPALGGAVVAAGGTSAALWVNVGLFLVIALTLLSGGARLPDAAPAGAPRARIRRAAAYASSHPAIRTLLMLQALAVLSFTISIPVEVVFAQHALHTAASGYGGLLSAWGGGAVAGSLVYARWHGADARSLMAVGAGLIGVGLASMAVAPNLGVALAAAAIAGVGNGIEAVAARTTLQESTDARWMTLVMSFSESLNEGMPGIGILVGGGLAAVAGPRVALAVGGVGALVITAATWGLLHPRRGVLQPASHSPG